ncbi:MAG: hypothetical protein ACFFDK_03800 [Promethearchaeota archaeon]
MSNEKNIPGIDNLQKIKEQAPAKHQKFNFLVFKLNLQSEEFDELKLTDDDKIEHLLDHDVILLFVDYMNSRIWIWEGKSTSPRMKFISAEAAPIIRDQYAIDYNISTIDDGDEPIEFKNFLGMELEV